MPETNQGTVKLCVWGGEGGEGGGDNTNATSELNSKTVNKTDAVQFLPIGGYKGGYGRFEPGKN